MKSRVAGTAGERVNKHYFDRGITMCDRWNSFDDFLADMGECPKGLTLERDDNDKGYEPGNCRWATHGEQVRNTQRTIRVQWAGREMCLKDACVMAGINYQCVRSRIRSGKAPQMALEMGKWSSP